MNIHIQAIEYQGDGSLLHFKKIYLTSLNRHQRLKELVFYSIVIITPPSSVHSSHLKLAISAN
jgi:hypothetical protein